jgi:hypothetical protein
VREAKGNLMWYSFWVYFVSVGIQKTGE